MRRRYAALLALLLFFSTPVLSGCKSENAIDTKGLSRMVLTIEGMT